MSFEIRNFLSVSLISAALALPAAAQMLPGDEARCQVAVSVSGPQAMRVTQEEAEERLRIRCRAGDVLVFRTDFDHPIGPLAALYCDMARPILVERFTEMLSPGPGADPVPIGSIIATCTYRGSRRNDR